MKALKTSFAVTALSLLLTATAQAGNINIGGVIWDPSHPLDFQSTSGNFSQTPGAVPLTGYGRIDFINGTPQAVFCPGCELTFTFTGYTPIAGQFPNVTGGFEFTGGSVTVYVDSTPDFDLLNGATAGADAGTQEWLVMTGAPIIGSQPDIFSPLATLLGSFGGAGATGVGLLDVVGGLAQGNFDTDGRFGGADLEFQNSFTQGTGFRFGSGNFFGDSIPEPGTLALFGLGFAGMGALSRRRRAQQG